MMLTVRKLRNLSKKNNFFEIRICELMMTSACILLIKGLLLSSNVY